ncbi:unnamed protein product [Brassica oleracea]|uniref:(rape) hypothetical protein n=1 Tax=Brassica napus TaxID=3708 RepID=A0A816M5P2_BRANA|nr:unnamed protein product [Brassica napus]
MQLPIWLRDTKDGAETSRRQGSYLLELGRWKMKHGRRVKLLENKRITDKRRLHLESRRYRQMGCLRNPRSRHREQQVESNQSPKACNG